MWNANYLNIGAWWYKLAVPHFSLDQSVWLVMILKHASNLKKKKKTPQNSFFSFITSQIFLGIIQSIPGVKYVEE